MATEYNDITARILALSLDERAKLAEQLIATLDSGQNVNAESEWLEEAERRYELYREGKLESLPADAVFEDAFHNLK